MKNKILKLEGYKDFNDRIETLNKSGYRIIQVLKYKYSCTGYYKATILVEKYDKF